MNYKSRLEYEEGSARGPKDNIICKKCIYRCKDFEDGYKKAMCEKYPWTNETNMKPISVSFENANCKYYKEDK